MSTDAQPADTPLPRHQVEIVAVVGEDGDDLAAFVDGAPVDVDAIILDPGKGYSLPEWRGLLASYASKASPAAARVLREWGAAAERDPHITSGWGGAV